MAIQVLTLDPSDTPEIDVPIGRGAKYGHIHCIAKFPQSVHDYIYLYGLRQVLNDACSDKKDGDKNPLPNAEVLALAQAKYDRLVAGELRKRGEASEPLDPVEREAYRLAKDAIIKAFKSKGLWPTKGEDKFQQAVDARMVNLRMEAMDAGDYIEKWLDANPKVRKSAERIVKERQSADDATLDAAGI